MAAARCWQASPPFRALNKTLPSPLQPCRLGVIAGRHSGAALGVGMRRILSGRSSRAGLWLSVACLMLANVAYGVGEIREIGPRMARLMDDRGCVVGAVAHQPSDACHAAVSINTGVRGAAVGLGTLFIAGQPLLNYAVVQWRLSKHADGLGSPAWQPDWSALTPVLVHLLLAYWIIVASIRRCHDRGMSGWWVLLSAVPVVGFVWWVRALGLAPGDVHDNRYGSRPRLA